MQFTKTKLFSYSVQLKQTKIFYKKSFTYIVLNSFLLEITLNFKTMSFLWNFSPNVAVVLISINNQSLLKIFPSIHGNMSNGRKQFDSKYFFLYLFSYCYLLYCKEILHRIILKTVFSSRKKVEKWEWETSKILQPPILLMYIGWKFCTPLVWNQSTTVQ